MKPILLVAVAALAIGCNSSPTAPSASPIESVAVPAADVKPDHTPGTQKVVIYFYSMDFGRNVLVDMPVDVWSESLPERTLWTSKQHNVSLDVPKTDNWVGYRIDAEHWPEICPLEGVLSLPRDLGANWVMVSRCPVQ